MKNVIIMLSMLSFLFVSQIGNARTAENLSEKEATDILYMLEEEKLARDVYIAFDEKWKSTIFSHISNAEQRHYDKMKKLATKFSLTIPTSVQKDVKGKFQNKTLQSAYDEMIELGYVSLENALRIGAKIEEMDIDDLNEAMENTKNEEILDVYANLKQASEKHLNSFYKNMNKQGIDYEPAVLDKTDFDGIINTKESCKGGEKEGKGCCSSKKGKSTSSEKGCGSKGKGKAKKGKGGACCSSSQ